MMPATKRTHLIDRLPKVRGRLTADAPLAPITWFGVGGPAEVMFRPVDPEDLASMLRRLSKDVPVQVFGVGSNLLVRDGGLPGVTLRLGRGFAGLTVEGPRIRVGAAVLDANVAQAAAAAGLGGLEFLSGVPGTIGGALRMNAGAYGGDMAGIVVEATALDRDGRTHKLGLRDLDFSYRHCGAPKDWIFVEALLQGAPGDAVSIAKKLKQIKADREATQPIRVKTGGSTFKNPPGDKAWRLIDEAGCRGLTLGGAQVSEKHCNFLINQGDATAADIEALGDLVRARVLEKCGVTLEWEIARIGEKV
jgi:UDP-N-acetylmuramate dehydrogenase